MANPEPERNKYPLMPGLLRSHWPELLAPDRVMNIIALALRRVIATGIDFFLLELMSVAGLYTLFVLAGQLSLPPFLGGNAFFNIMLWAFLPLLPWLPLLILIGIETKYGSSPGKFAVGLRLKLSDHIALRLIQLGLRNALKWIPFFMFLLGSPFVRVYDSWPSTGWLHKDAWMYLALPVLWGLSGLICLVFRPERQLQDWLSGTQVEIAGTFSWKARLGMGLVSAAGTMLSVMVISVAASQFRGEDRAKLSSVKANMHTLQTLVETYAMDWKGEYPRNTLAVNQDAVQGKYWKDFVNPFTSRSGRYYSFADIGAFSSLSQDHAGLVLYDPIVSQGKVSHYYLYGLDQEGRRIRDKGQDFVLTNS